MVLMLPDTTDEPTPEHPADDLAAVNALLADWAARSASDSDALIARLEALGYEVRGKSEADVAEVLRHPPTRR